MRLVGTSEWIVIGVLIAYMAFTPGFPVVRQFLSTGLGKAIGLAVVVATWKYVSHPVALLLLVNFVRCSGMREYLESGSGAPSSGTTLPENTHCPENYSFDNGQCKNKTTSQTIPATVCLAGQTWDGSKCAGSSAASAPPASAPPPATTSSTTAKQPFSNMTPSPIVGGVQPSMPEKENFAPA